MEWKPPVSHVRRNHLKNGTVSMSADERRAEERIQVEGKVKLRFTDPSPLTVEGSLLDYSTSGFRAVHQHQSLQTGEIVEFAHFVSSGRARVMWNRISDGSVQTGFLVL